MPKTGRPEIGSSGCFFSFDLAFVRAVPIGAQATEIGRDHFENSDGRNNSINGNDNGNNNNTSTITGTNKKSCV